MTSSARTGADHDYHRPDPACDPGLLDELRCDASGIQAQADYNASKAEELQKARDSYDAARAAYTAARRAAEPLVSEAWRQVEDLVDRVSCQLDPSDVAKLDRAFEHVLERIEACGGSTGCCSDGDCDYDDEVRDCDPDDVPGHIATITRNTVEATACFTRLIAEPTPDGLPARVTAVRDEIGKVAKAAADGTWETTRLYAAALVARYHLKTVWRGFATVNDYMDCLCHALTCMIRGHAAVAELTRKAAVHECQRASWLAACQRLEEKTVDEVVAEYIRVCAQDDDDDDDEGNGSGAGYADTDDGGGRPAYGGRPGRRPRAERPAEGYGRPKEPPPSDYDGPDPADPGEPPEEEPPYEDAPRRPGRRAPGDRRPYRDDRGRYRAP